MANIQDAAAPPPAIAPEFVTGATGLVVDDPEVAPVVSAAVPVPPVVPAAVPVPPAVEQLAQATEQIVGQAVGEVSAEVREAIASAQKAAADELAAIYKTMPGVATDLISGNTVAEVKASLERAQGVFQSIKNAVLHDLGAALPGGHAGGSAAPVPTSPLDMIAAGLRQK